jgi:threonine synthase
MKKNAYYDYSFFVPSYDQVSISSTDLGNSFSTYAALLPFNMDISLSLGEANTPLTTAKNLGNYFALENLRIKHEELNPTGSFKDRESFVAINLASQRGLSEVVIASSGNAAVSLAAYAQKAKIACHCFVPKDTTVEKKKLIAFFGAKISEVDGNYEQVYRLVADTYPASSNFTSGICSERTEADKTIAYEIWEEVGVPDVVVVPAGNGSNLAGIWKGFDDLVRLGKTQSVPKMVGVQIKGAAPLALALEQNLEISPWENNIESVAEGIVAVESFCSPKAVRAIRESGGFVVEVEDGEVTESLYRVLREESLLIEPTSAAAFAAISSLESRGVSKKSNIVIVNTGSGTKMIEEVSALLSSQFSPRS